MPRDSSGNYSLPAGNPVVSGTTITSTWANPTMDDIAQSLTDSLDRQGRGGMLAPFLFADGAENAPAVAFVNEPGSGLYRQGAGEVRMSIAGIDRTRWTTDNDNPFQIWSVTAGSWSVPLNSQADYTINGAWNFAGTAPTIGGAAILTDVNQNINSDWTFLGNIIFANTISGTTDGNLVTSDLNNYTEKNQTETITSPWIMPTDFKVKDGAGANLLAAYRNPSTFSITTGDDTLQSQEGRIGTYSGAGAGVYNIEALTAGTNITVKVRGAGILSLVDGGGVTLNWTDGMGGAVPTGTLLIAPNSVVHLNWVSTSLVEVWGNGISQ